MPACNIQVMGSQKKAALGMGKSSLALHRGLFEQMEIVQSAPAGW